MGSYEDNKVNLATKWSVVTTLLKYLAAPITNLILARILAPEIFGVVATINIIVSLADALSEAGFSKFVVQHEFGDSKELYENANVAFTYNLSISIIGFIIIAVNRDVLATLVGSKDYGMQLMVAGLSLPLTSFSCIQQALFRRKFDFKGLFLARAIRLIIPFVVTIPLAVFLKNEWALIIGLVIMNFSDALVLTIKSEWKPRILIHSSLIKPMIIYSAWSFLETIAIWFCTNGDVFIIGTSFDSYHTGIYKNSLLTVGQITSIVSMAILPVLFSSLSRCQDDENEFKKIFYLFQRNTGIVAIPLCMAIYTFNDVVTGVLLGRKWGDAAYFIKILGPVQIIILLIAYFSSEVYRAKGSPKTSFVVQIIYAVTMIALLRWAITVGDFDFVCEIRVVTFVVFAIIHSIVLKIKYSFNIFELYKAQIKPVLFSGVAVLAALCVRKDQDSIILTMLSMVVYCVIYVLSCMIFSDTRQILINMIRQIRIRGKR